MKKWYVTVIALLILTWILAAVTLMLLPDTIPVHYNAAGEVDRIGSKYEQLILPVFLTVLSVAFLFVVEKKEIFGEKRSLILTCIVMQTVLLAVFVYLSVSALRYNGGTSLALPLDVWRFAAILFGVLLATVGLLLKDVPRNRFLGLRTKWSLSSDTAWKKSQHFAGVSGIVVGCLILLLVCFLKEVAVMIAVCALLVLWCVLGVVASYRYAKKENG